MRALQLHFSAGDIHLRACSRGLNRKDQQRISDWSRAAPAAFQYRTLVQNRAALILSTLSAGAEERRGVHALVFERKNLSLWPVDYLDWPGWARWLPPADPAFRKPTPLPAVDLVGVEPAEQASLQSLGRFLGERADRSRLLSAMIAALFLYPRYARPLVIRDQPENGLLWVACLQKSLPLLHARQLSFSSHQYSEQDTAVVNATTSGAGFTFDGVQRDRQFFMFDLSGERLNSVIPDDEIVKKARVYGDRIARWMLEDPERLAGFHRFVATHFSHDRLSVDIWWALRLYEHGLDPALALGHEEIGPVIGFAETYVRPDTWGRVAECMAPLADHLARQGWTQDWRALCDFFDMAAHATNAPKQRLQVFGVWRRMLDALMAERRQDLSPALRVYADLEKRFPDHRSDLYKTILEPAHLRHLRVRMTTLRLEALGSLVWLLLDAALKLDWSAEDVTTEFGAFLAGLVGFGPSSGLIFHKLLNRCAGRPEVAAALCLLAWRNAERAPEYLRKEACAVIVGIAADYLNGRPQAEAMSVRRWLSDNREMPLLFEEWRVLLRRSGDRRSLYKKYRVTVLAELDAYREDYLAAVCSTLFEALDAKARERQGLDWILSDDWQALPDQLAAVCLKLVNAQLSLDLHNLREEALANQVDEYARERSVVMEPHKPLLRACLRHLSPGALREGWFDDVRRALCGVGRDDYRRFLEAALPMLVNNAGRRDDHRSIIDALSLASHVDLFEQKYANRLAEIAERDAVVPAALAAALHFWIAPYGRIQSDPALAGMPQRMRDRLLRNFAQWDAWRLRELLPTVAKLVKPDGYEMREAWRDFVDKLEQERRVEADKAEGVLKKVAGLARVFK